jgi:hypothetical protein
MSIKIASALTIACALSLAASAEAQDARRQLDAHAHGEGRVAIAIEGNRVEMELEAPAHDIVGFEHAPSNAKQRKVISDARAILAKLERFVSLPSAAGCKPVTSKVEVIGAAAGTGKGKGRHAHGHSHDHHGHAHNHAGGKAKTAGSAKAEGDHAHSEFRVTYALDCKSPARLETISFEYFKAFAGAEKLNVTVIGPKGQASHVVTRAKPVLDLGGLS